VELPSYGSPIEPFGQGRGFVDRDSPANPAAGAGLVYRLNSNWLFRPLSVRFAVTTDANVANRFVTLDYCDSEGNVYVRNAAGLVLTASTTAQVFDFNAQRTVAEWATNTDILAPLADMFLPGGWQIQVNLSNIQAGDQIASARLYFERWTTGGGEDLGAAASAGASRRRRG
jgi:hypothetical protein